MLKGYRRLWEARTWMKKNESFLPTWHAYVGYELDLFTQLSTWQDPQAIIRKYGYDAKLMNCWVDAGLVLGHLKGRGTRVKASARMLKYFSRQSDQNIGELLKEMLELHMPVLMHYPRMIQTKKKEVFCSDKFSHTVAATSSLIEQKSLSHIADEVRAQRPKWVLDIGCGTGGYLMQLAKKVHKSRYIGIDISRKLIEKARQNAKKRHLDKRVKFYYADIEQWQAPQDFFQVIMMNNLLHYYPLHQREGLFRNIARYLSPEGVLIVITPLYLEKGGQCFSAAFNSFTSAHENLYALPKREQLVTDAARAGLKLAFFKTVIKEGSWYYLSFIKNKLPISE
ncbi:class I SAM-dependent methyltransferase [Bacillus xiapuensis]|uniref:class I SAM-dependent methyltransferase n=1 Tax=Bacillus xiapuensis TaxID=2014075 RepID=UPI000C23EF69|nr:methyltransferase domain-containing protein [Bacillus xiapuensis]